MAGESLKADKRIRYLDVAKGIGILMVTFGHITELSNPVDDYMSLYKITLFYFISGYLLSYLNRYKETGYGKYFLGVCRHIGLPYVLFSIAAIGIRVFRAYVRMKPVEPLFEELLIRTVNLRGIATLWFLPTIFFSQIIIFIIAKNSNHILGKIAMASVFFWPAAALMYWNTYTPELGVQSVAAKSLVAAWFMAAGFLYHKLIQDRIDPRLRFVIGVLLTGFTFWLTRFSSNIDFNLMMYGDHPWAFFVGGITGSLGLVMVLEALEHVYTSKLLEYCGKNSLIIMCAQRGLLFLNVIAAGWGVMFRETEVVCADYYIDSVCILVLLVLMCGGLIELIKGFKSLFARTAKKSA